MTGLCPSHLFPSPVECATLIYSSYPSISMRGYPRINVVQPIFSSFISRNFGIFAIPSSCSTFRRSSSTSSQSSLIMSVKEYRYDWIDGAEPLEKYRPGGYHPVMIGDMLHQRYRIVDKLGFGGLFNRLVRSRHSVETIRCHQNMYSRCTSLREPRSQSTIVSVFIFPSRAEIDPITLR